MIFGHIILATIPTLYTIFSFFFSSSLFPLLPLHLLQLSLSIFNSPLSFFFSYSTLQLTRKNEFLLRTMISLTMCRHYEIRVGLCDGGGRRRERISDGVKEKKRSSVATTVVWILVVKKKNVVVRQKKRPPRHREFQILTDLKGERRWWRMEGAVGRTVVGGEDMEDGRRVREKTQRREEEGRGKTVVFLQNCPYF
ncbi:hypothetical protein MtrunA17_Chr8g0391021 [Medicago truncatula]|uniref:Transmembrane protein n=2 Tax=Medicago truncatula TaxID=3880 RepID=A0A396GYJ6_MEDTR|nr:hypothetical protein MtrunA17_Chr8g0391021 [Medicago truncatula]